MLCLEIRGSGIGFDSFPLAVNLLRKNILPLLKKHLSIICDSISHPALTKAGVMYLVQMSLSDKVFLRLNIPGFVAQNKQSRTELPADNSHIKFFARPKISS